MAPQTRKRNYNQNTTKDTSVEKPTSEEKRKLPVRAKDGDSSDGATPTLMESKGTKVVFGDDDNDSPAPPPLLVPKSAVQVEEDEEDNSDDEAPEAVSTSKVASDIKKSNQAAQKAAQEEAAAQKRKRRERDGFFKQQAEERKKLEGQEKAGANEEPSVEEGPAQSLIQRSKAEKAVNLLPAEFLTDSSEDEADGIDDDQPEARPRKRRVATVERSLARQERGPKDERVGSTVYRVAKKTDERMAPKLKKHAKSSKDILLKRNRSVTQQRSGFFVR
ncbi:u3 snorna associated [Fusarium circinatum]|uniref:U3 snorna associated n=1 Tax=Fusarium circinatum TaxID=48490 RepID=A0A8H5SSK2_FUSCI|nr:u3 snorna associated [Fusarium circinatum]